MLLKLAFVTFLGAFGATQALSSTTLLTSDKRNGGPFVPSYRPSTVSKLPAGVALTCTVALVEL